MDILDFTAEETSLIAIYSDGTREATLANMTAALIGMDSTMRDIAERSAARLTAMSDEDFATATFTLADDTDDIA
jgi:hypothetical protein